MGRGFEKTFDINQSILGTAHGLVGIDALVEVHDESELERALAIEAVLIGVNQRGVFNGMRAGRAEAQAYDEGALVRLRALSETLTGVR